MDGIAVEQLVAAHIEPTPFGQPCGAVGLAVDARGCHHGGYEDIVAKEVLILKAIGIVLFRPFVVERATEGDTRVVSLATGIIDIGHQGIAQLYGL